MQTRFNWLHRQNTGQPTVVRIRITQTFQLAASPEYRSTLQEPWTTWITFQLAASPEYRSTCYGNLLLWRRFNWLHRQNTGQLYSGKIYGLHGFNWLHRQNTGQHFLMKDGLYLVSIGCIARIPVNKSEIPGLYAQTFQLAASPEYRSTRKK